VKEKRRAEPNGERQREGPRPMPGRGLRIQGRRPWAYGGLGPLPNPQRIIQQKRNLDLGLKCLMKTSI
jgi:hypothetical protein